MKRLNNRRRWYARLLLCIFVPMLMLASVHVHQPSGNVSDSCYACLHHIHHDGHLSSTTLTIDNCLLCHFLTVPYVAAAVVAIAFISITVGKASALPLACITATSHDANHLRAPPVCL